MEERRKTGEGGRADEGEGRKEAAKDRVLLCTNVHEHLLCRVVSAPMARVPKQNPDRTMSDKGRLI